MLISFWPHWSTRYIFYCVYTLILILLQNDQEKKYHDDDGAEKEDELRDGILRAALDDYLTSSHDAIKRLMPSGIKNIKYCNEQ